MACTVMSLYYSIWYWINNIVMSFVENNNFDKIENSTSWEAIVSKRLHSKPPLMQSKKARVVVWNEKLLLTNLSKNEWPGQDKFNSSWCIRLEKAGVGSWERVM